MELGGFVVPSRGRGCDRGTPTSSSQSVSQSVVSQSVSQSLSRSVSQSVSQSVGRSVSQSVTTVCLPFNRHFFGTPSIYICVITKGSLSYLSSPCFSKNVLQSGVGIVH